MLVRIKAPGFRRIVRVLNRRSSRNLESVGFRSPGHAYRSYGQNDGLSPPCSDVLTSKSDTLHEDHASARGILLVLEARELEVQEKEMSDVV